MEYELPIFPLNTVLFPGMPLSLHIFEERYKSMIHECVETGAPFGVALIREGIEALGPLAEPYSVGCTAEIAQVQPLLGGRMNILVLGRERFRILTLQRDALYLKGLVQDFPLGKALGEDATACCRKLRPWVEEYLLLLSEAGDVDFDVEQLPSEPQSLAYLAATVLQIPNEQKQELLSTPAASNLLSQTRAHYRRELPLLRRLLAEDETAPEGPGPFSLS